MGREDTAAAAAVDGSTQSTQPQDPMNVKRAEHAAGGSWRKDAGQVVTQTQQAIDANLTLFRLGCVLTMVGSVAAGVKLSGVLRRFDHVNDIPSWYFTQHKKLRVRLLRQSTQDPSVFYVYHTPFWRRAVLQDSLPKDELFTDESRLIAVRVFGVTVDECSQEWIWANFVSSHRYMTVQLLHRLTVGTGEHADAIATCNVSLRRPPFAQDFAQEIVSRGCGEYLHESMDKYADSTPGHLDSLKARLDKLETCQRHAQVMQYGIWKDWQDADLSTRVVSAGKRATAKGLQKIISTLRH